MKETFLDKFMSRKGLYVTFWIMAITMVSALIYYTANLQKEVPPIPSTVKSVSGEVLYTYNDVVEGKGFFQQFDLMDWGTLLGMGAYMGPDFSTDFMHYRAEFLYDFYGKELYNKTNKELTFVERGAVKERVKQDFKKQTKLLETTTVYTNASALAFLYMASRTNSLANNLVWDEKISKIGFWLLTVGVLLFALPTYIIGIEQTRIAQEMGYFYTRLRSAVEPLKGWMWFRIVPDTLMLLGGITIFYDLVTKTYFAKKNS